MSVAALFLLALSARAEFQAHPRLKLTETYDSNVLLRPRDPLRSWIHSLEGGGKASWQPTALHRLDAEYSAVYEAFSKNPSANNALNQEADFSYTYAEPGGITARAKDAYVNTVDPPNAEQTDRLRRWRNAALLEAEYAPPGGRLYLAGEGSHAAHKYVSGDGRLNRWEAEVGAKAGWRLFPRTKAYALYRRGIIRYTATPPRPPRDNKSHSFGGGVESEFAAKLDARAEAWINGRRYEDGTARELIVSIDVGWQPRERTRLELSGGRRLEEAFTTGSRYYSATGASLRATHKMGRATALVHGGFERDVFSGVSRRDDVYRAGAGADYDVTQRVKVSFSYLHRARFSRQLPERFNYRGHTTSLSVSLQL